MGKADDYNNKDIEAEAADFSRAWGGLTDQIAKENKALYQKKPEDVEKWTSKDLWHDTPHPFFNTGGCCPVWNSSSKIARLLHPGNNRNFTDQNAPLHQWPGHYYKTDDIKNPILRPPDECRFGPNDKPLVRTLGTPRPELWEHTIKIKALKINRINELKKQQQELSDAEKVAKLGKYEHNGVDWPSRRVLEGVSSPLAQFVEELRAKERSPGSVIRDMDCFSTRSLSSSAATGFSGSQMGARAKARLEARANRKKYKAKSENSSIQFG